MIKKIQKFIDKQKKFFAEISFKEKMESLFTSLSICEMKIQIGSDILQYSNLITNRLWTLRSNIKENTGLILPPIRVQDNPNLQENEFVIYIRDKVVFNNFTIPNNKLAVDDILFNLELICLFNTESIFSNATIESYINVVERKNRRLVSEIFYYKDLIEIKKILLGLIKNNRSIKDITYIFEQIAKYNNTRNTDLIITEISETLPKYEWSVRKKEETSKCDLEKIFQL